jgi:hypothetical protein
MVDPSQVAVCCAWYRLGRMPATKASIHMHGVFADVADGKIQAPATAGELAMVPPDLKSRISLASSEALLLCVERLQLLVRSACM